VVAAYYTNGNDKFKIAWLSDEGEPLGICVAKDNPDLAAAVESALDTMYFDGSMPEIALKNFGQDFTEGLRFVDEKPEIPTGIKTIKDGTLSVGVEVGYPPMEYTTDDGKEFIGFDIDVANKLGELLGLDVNFVNTSWDGIFAGLEKGQYDLIISSVSINPERVEKYNMTEPYVSNSLCIVVKNED
jgi:ABC-type amino acid transport substrate-binding protein